MLSVRSSFSLLVLLVLAGCISAPTPMQSVSDDLTPFSTAATPPQTGRAETRSPVGVQQFALSGTKWALVQLRNHDLSGATTITLEFTADEFRGTAGCNQYRGPYSIDGNTITIRELQSTLLVCSDRVWEQAEQYHDALVSAATYRRTVDRLEIYDHTDEILLVFVPSWQAPRASFEGQLWELESMTVPPSTRTPGLVPTTALLSGFGMTAQFIEGEVTGTTGCNEYSGSYTFDARNLSITELTWTANICADVGFMEDHAATYLYILQDVDTYSIQRGRLGLGTWAGAGLVYLATELPE